MLHAPGRHGVLRLLARAGSGDLVQSTVVWLFAWLMFLRLGLPQHHICSAISRDLLGPAPPLAQLPQPSSATVWT